jgi:hypothetical protein
VNSLALGASLVARGSPVISNDSFQLLASSIAPTATMLFSQGTLQDNGGAGSVLGDGLSCVAGARVRLGIATCDANGTAVWPPPGGPSISQTGLIGSAGARYYQVMYRDASSFCTSDTFSHTNGVSASWVP